MTKFLNLDKIKKVTGRGITTSDGVNHVLKALSVNDFILNTKLVALMKDRPGDQAFELECIIEMIGRSFPTLTEEVIRSLSVDELTAIIGYSQSVDGTDTAEDDAITNPKNAVA